MAKRFEDLEVWVSARDFASQVYKSTDEGRIRSDFGLKEQLRRAAISIVSNIAEGFERNGNKEFIQFLSIAKGSAGEIRAQLYVAYDIGYLDESTFNDLTIKITRISSMISKLIQYLKNSEFKGSRYDHDPEEEYSKTPNLER